MEIHQIRKSKLFANSVSLREHITSLRFVTHSESDNLRNKSSLIGGQQWLSHLGGQQCRYHRCDYSHYEFLFALQPLSDPR